MTRRYTVLQVDGIESGLGILTTSGIAFLINGKSDGHAIADGGTQVMVGLLGSILRENASRALVIGLGTGTTTGWLAANPGMERVDAVELEGSVLKVAEACAPVNRNVLANPKAHIHIADAREWLLTTRQKYDLIASEPSNPYRVGVASLYTADYYRAAARALRPNGLFLQWVQAYEVDGQTIRSIYATFNSVFPVVETWQTDDADLLFIGGMEPFAYDVPALRQRIAEEPFKSALTKVWRVNDLEGIFSHYIANDAFAKEISSDRDALINTDDRNIIEFSVARTVGTEVSFAIPILREEAHRRGQDRPARVNGDIDWTRVDDQNASIYTQASRISAPSYSFFTADQRSCALAQNAYVAGNAPAAMELWRHQSRDAGSLTEWTMMAEILASAGQPEALGYIQKVSEAYPAEGAMLLAILRTREKRFAEATDTLISAYDACRTDPWPMDLIFRRSFDIAIEIAARDESGSLAPRLFQVLQQPFAVKANEADRRRALLAIARIIDKGVGESTHKALAIFEPHVPWEREFLKTRRDCYRSLNDPLAAKAERDLIAFLKAEPAPFISDKQD